MSNWQCQKTELLLAHRFMKIKRDIVKVPNGETKEWVYWDSRDSAMVLGMTTNKKLVMIRQHRYLVGHEVIEFPSGGLHENETPEDGAKREFEEETGYKCEKLIKLGSFYETYGQLNRQIHFFFAPQITQSNQDLDHHERGFEDISIELVDFGQAIELANQNKIVAMGSSLAILLLKEKIKSGEILFS